MSDKDEDKPSTGFPMSSLMAQAMREMRLDQEEEAPKEEGESDSTAPIVPALSAAVTAPVSTPLMSARTEDSTQPTTDETQPTESNNYRLSEEPYVGTNIDDVEGDEEEIT